MYFTARGGFPMYFPIGKSPNLIIPPPPAVSLAYSSREKPKSQIFPASGGFPLYFL